MKVTIKQLEQITFAGIGDTGHWVLMDNTPEFGGYGGASKPMEMVLMALGGCTGMDVASILGKMRVPLKNMEVIVEGEQAETHPKVFTRIHIEFLFYGTDIPKDKVEQAVALSKDKYCSVMAMLRQSVKIITSYQIRPERS
ncbi:MAG TPA: OsmC family peroxiredoxin [bacterium]|nr:OsmC family peroxiredoxin [bacterium]